MAHSVAKAVADTYLLGLFSLLGLLVAVSMRRVSRAATLLMFPIVLLPLMHTVCASSSRSNSAMSHKVTGYPADNRTLNAAARPRIDW
jgi:hypothetical protein